MVRFTSNADIDATQTDVCFVPIADIGQMKEADCEDEAGSKADNRYWNSSTRPL